jgi:hypothetical protein
MISFSDISEARNALSEIFYDHGVKFRGLNDVVNGLWRFGSSGTVVGSHIPISKLSFPPQHSGLMWWAWKPVPGFR